MKPGQLAGIFCFLRFENIHFSPLQPEHTGRGGHFQLFSTGNAGLGEPVAADNHLAVLLHPIRPYASGSLPGLRGDTGDRQSRVGERCQPWPGAATVWPSYPAGLQDYQG